ncbi:MAG: bacteriohemerythrin [Candidatus Magnetominusculus sp. LBB02]|nr:bacteriohemerythrin [Candidatus Magnetominusculus sp. LBB02]
MFIDFDSKLKVDVSDIDNQHKKLVEMVNELHGAMSIGKGAAVLGGILTKLVDYTKEHFAMEEGLIQKYKYDDGNHHKSEHDKLTKQVMDLKKQFSEGKMVVTIDVLNFLKGWLNDHIKDVDKKLAHFLISKGVK